MKRQVEKGLENFLFAARWLAAPIYLGLVFCLFMLLVTFVRYMIMVAQQVMTLSFHDTAVAVVAFIDLALIANLVLIVIFVGYENFVSKIEAAQQSKDRPDWMGTVDFGGLKLKLVASIVAISGIHLLKSFMKITDGTVGDRQMFWLVVTHLTFVTSGLLLALMDRMTPHEEVVRPDGKGRDPF